MDENTKRLLLNEWNLSISQDEYQKLLTIMDKETFYDIAEDLNDYVGATGKKYVSHYHVIKIWHKSRRNKLPRQADYDNDDSDDEVSKNIRKDVRESLGNEFEDDEC